MEKNVNKMVNKVELNGFVGSEPKVVALRNGGLLTQISVATSASYQNKKGEWVKDTTWHKVIFWNKLADKVSSVIKKGSRVALEGKLVTRSFTDEKGKKHQIIEIVGNSFDIMPTSPMVA